MSNKLKVSVSNNGETIKKDNDIANFITFHDKTNINTEDIEYINYIDRYFYPMEKLLEDNRITVSEITTNIILEIMKLVSDSTNTMEVLNYFKSLLIESITNIIASFFNNDEDNYYDEYYITNIYYNILNCCKISSLYINEYKLDILVNKLFGGEIF